MSVQKWLTDLNKVFLPAADHFNVVGVDEQVGFQSKTDLIGDVNAWFKGTAGIGKKGTVVDSFKAVKVRAGTMDRCGDVMAGPVDKIGAKARIGYDFSDCFVYLGACHLSFGIDKLDASFLGVEEGFKEGLLLGGGWSAVKGHPS